ncbi:DUF5700 domain-containing putative Zn-dependent protease [Candidatus Neomarinimicrobiota bacterium]
MNRTILTMFALYFLTMGISAQTTNQNEQEIKIVIDDSAARYVLENPKEAIKERNQIWGAYEGYRITKVWHEGSNYPLTWKFWDRGLEKITNSDTLLAHKSLKLINDIRSLETLGHDNIVNHLASYLPQKTNFDAFVYFVAFTAPYAFTIEQNKIGIDITGHEWHFDPNCLMNIIIHEMYHVGYKTISPDGKILSLDPKNYEQYVSYNYAYMFSEGIATHVAFKALDLFPSSYKHDDYKLMENDQNIKNAIKSINQLNEIAKTEDIETMNQKAWDVGVMDRAYYLAGAYMCKVIEDKFGIECLADIVTKGGLQFTKVYNELVMEDYKIKLIVS